MVDTVAEAFTDTVATRTDIAEVKADLKADIARLEGRIDSGLANLKADVAEAKADLLKVAIGIAIGIILANATLTFAMLRLLLR